jgi:hypothetical protein
MSDQLNLINTRLRSDDLRTQAETWRRGHRTGRTDNRSTPGTTAGPARAIVIRGAGEGDARALRRLAHLEGRWLSPQLRILVAEVDGEVQAALPVNGGEALADPFRHTAALVEMLRLRASELRAGTEQRPRRGLRALIAQLRPA